MDLETLWHITGNASALVVALIAARIAWAYTVRDFQ